MAAPQYTLYELVAREDDKESQSGHSPFVNKTKADLAILGVPYKSVPLTFIGIRDELVKLTGNDKVTVPTLQVGEGKFITDSFEIAAYLDKHHGTADKRLFPSPESLASIRLIDLYLDTDWIFEVRELFRPLFYTIKDKPSADYFLKNKYAGDKALIDRQIADLGDADKVAALGKRARVKTVALERLLSEARNGGPFILGDKPTHADASLWGWYAFSLGNAPALHKHLWEHPDLPHVTKWLEAMKKATGLKVEYPKPPVPLAT